MTEQATTTTAHERTKQKLQTLGLALPEPIMPVGSYVPATTVGTLVFTSGQLPLDNGALAGTGKLGTDVTAERGYELAALCALNALAAASAHGDLDKARIVKVVGFVASAEGFNGQPAVINGASDLLVEIFGENGKHARSAVGVAELPLNAPVEVELVIEFS